MTEPKERDLAKVLRAVRFAAKKHVKQRRKGGNDVPYINHPIEVAETLARLCGVTDPDVLAAAILHDTVEDTDTSREEIVDQFGETVASMVMECTDDKSLPSERRKALQIETAPHKTAKAKLIKAADKLSNMIDMEISPPSGWSKQRRIDYIEWSAKVMVGLRGQCHELDVLYDQVHERALKKAESTSN